MLPVSARSSSNGFHVLRVVWWSPAPPLFSLPRAARVGRYLQSSAAPVVVSQKRLHVSLLLKAASFLSLFAPCAGRFTWAVSFSCTAARWPSTHATEFCQLVFIRRILRNPHCGADFLLNTVRPPVSVSIAVFRLLLNASRLPCLSCPGLHVLPARQSLHALSCSEASVPALPRSCVCWSLLLWSCSSFAAVFMEPSCSFSLHQPVLDLALSFGTLAPVILLLGHIKFCSSPYLCRPH